MSLRRFGLSLKDDPLLALGFDLTLFAAILGTLITLLIPLGRHALLGRHNILFTPGAWLSREPDAPPSLGPIPPYPWVMAELFPAYAHAFVLSWLLIVKQWVVRRMKEPVELSERNVEQAYRLQGIRLLLWSSLAAGWGMMVAGWSFL